MQFVRRAPTLACAVPRFFSGLPANIRKTPLFELHGATNGKIVDFCGWALPVQFPMGVLKEHLHVREKCGLFDVSHMQPLRILGKDGIKFLESITVADLKALKPNEGRLSSITNENGGIIDDTIITRRKDHIYMVVNAACGEKDLKHMAEKLGPFVAAGHDVTIAPYEKRTLLALQGPTAVKVMETLVPASVDLSRMPFMSMADIEVAGVLCHVTRSGYTGEDGFELMVPVEHSRAVAEAMLAHPDCKPIGLGARDSLRLEAGLCLYGNDIDATTTPIEGGLLWTISKRRRVEGGFPGDKIILEQIRDPSKVLRRKVGLVLEEVNAPPARPHTKLQDDSGKEIGEVTSGGFSPMLKKPISMAYVASEHAAAGTVVKAIVRGKAWNATVVNLPFFPTRFYRMPK